MEWRSRHPAKLAIAIRMPAHPVCRKRVALKALGNDYRRPVLDAYLSRSATNSGPQSLPVKSTGWKPRAVRAESGLWNVKALT